MLGDSSKAGREGVSVTWTSALSCSLSGPGADYPADVGGDDNPNARRAFSRICVSYAANAVS
jgi:hypothetical protein